MYLYIYIYIYTSIYLGPGAPQVYSPQQHEELCDLGVGSRAPLLCPFVACGGRLEPRKVNEILTRGYIWIIWVIYGLYMSHNNHIYMVIMVLYVCIYIYNNHWLYMS